VIAQEAGCAVSGSHTASQADDPFDVTEEILTGRKLLVIRAIAGTNVRNQHSIIFCSFTQRTHEQEETPRAAQKRIMREVYETVIDIEAA
jgi:myo-inositol-1(or 4)-monophosphatase